MDNRFDSSETGSDLVSKGSPRIAAFFASLDRMLDKLERMAVTCKPALKGERYLTDIEVSKQLKVSRRTLQEWRYSGQIAYLQVGGKILFRESDIQAILEKNLRKTSK